MKNPQTINIDFSTLRDGGPNTPPNKNFIAQGGNQTILQKV